MSGSPAGDASESDPDGRRESAAATAGVVVAGLALVSAALPWNGEPLLAVSGVAAPLAGIFGALALGAFVLSRHGIVDSSAPAVGAAVTSVGLFSYAAVRLLGPAIGEGSGPTSIGVGLALGALAGLLGAPLAYADYRSVPGTTLLEMGKRTAVGFLLVVAGFITAIVLSVPFLVLSLSDAIRLVVSVVLTGVGLAAVGVAFLVLTGRGLDYVDVRMPSVRDLVYAAGGVVVLFVGLFSLSITLQCLGLPTADNAVTRPALEGNPETLLFLIPLSYLVTGPGEELLSRNVIQKYLYGPFSRHAAVVVASVIFAVAHASSYSDTSPVATVTSLAVVFLLSLVLGAVYERTENVLVPAFVHGTFNAFQFALLYLALTMGGGTTGGGIC